MLMPEKVQDGVGNGRGVHTVDATASWAGIEGSGTESAYL